MARIIVFEGTDASGKATQSKLLEKRLRAAGYNVIKRSFPAYEVDSSLFVRNYLGGKYGENASDISPYAASTFYAVDRYDSFHTDWKVFTEKENTIIVLDRYVTSNIVHQCSKIESKKDKLKFIRWAQELEYIHMGLPKPDLVFFLKMPTEKVIELKTTRTEDLGVEEDLHEKDHEHLRLAFDNACSVSSLLKWETIDCVDAEDNIRTIDNISNEIFKKAAKSVVYNGIIV